MHVASVEHYKLIWILKARQQTKCSHVRVFSEVEQDLGGQEIEPVIQCSERQLYQQLQQLLL